LPRRRAALGLGERDAARRRDLDSIALAALAVELAAALSGEDVHRRAGIDDVPRAETTPGTIVPLALLGSSLLLPGRLSRAASVVGSLATLGGALTMRIRVLQQGDQSARQPRHSLRFTQPDNLPRR
jgi:hypothetical protein